jgi:chromosome segregation ATPase
MGIVMSDEWLERIERKIDAQARSQQRLVTVLDSHTTWLESHDKHFEALDKRLDTHDKRFEVLETKLDAIDNKLDAHDKRLDAIDNKLDAQSKQLDAQSKQLDAHGKQLDAQSKQLDAHGKQLDAHGKQLDAHGTEQHRLGVLVEKLQDDVRGVAEGLIGLGDRMDRGFRDVLVRLDERIAPLEAAFRSVAATGADHERRLPKRPRRRRHD